MTRTLFSALLLAGVLTWAACDPSTEPPPPDGACAVDGKVYQAGENFPSSDGCNTCFCSAGGAVGCTKKACPAPTTGKPCVAGGCSGQICADESVVSTCEWRPEYACYKSATCERQADGKCGWTKTAELEACLASAK